MAKKPVASKGVKPKTSSQRPPSAALLAAMKAQPPKPPPQDKLDRVNDLARTARDKRITLEDTKSRATELGKEILEIEHHTLPDLMMEVKIKELTLDAEGNHPAYALKLKPYYKASISAEWPDEQRDKAFRYLEKVGSPDLIKTIFVIEINREDHALAKKIENALDKLQVGYAREQSVPWNTLTAWVKERIEKLGEDVELDTIGATVGNIVTIKPVKEK